MTVSTANGTFYRDAAGQLQYAPSAGSDSLHMTMMSRKGLLPEADFYCDYPYRPLSICTPETVQEAIAAGSSRLLDRTFDLFARELAACDPDYAMHIALASLSADDFDVGDYAEAVLTEFGYTVLRADNADAALTLLDGAGAIDLLFSDLIMPGGMNGVMLAREVKRRRPRMRVLLTTGYAESSIERVDARG